MKRHSVLRLLRLMIPHRKAVILAGLSVLLVNCAELMKPIILKIVIDDFLILKKPETGLYSIKSMGILYMVIIVLGSLFTFVQINLMNHVGQQIISGLRRKVFNHIQHLPLSYLDKYSTGRLITRATNDVEALNEMFTDVLINLFRDVFLLIGIVFAMFSMHVSLALISLVALPLIFLITCYFKNRIKENFQLMKSLIGRINGFFAENLSGMKLVQVFNRELEKQKEFKELNTQYHESTLFQIKMNSLLRPIIEILQTMTIAVLVWYGMGKVMNQTLELGVLYAFTNYIKQFFAPINDLAENYNTVQSAVVSADRIFELLDQEDILEDLDSGLPIDELKGEIEFKNVWFAYREKEWILKNVSFKIAPRETAAFVGATGAGKTTIINLISRLYEIQKGEILIDGVNIKDYKLRDLRSNVAVVLQDVFLFSGDIKSNIRLNSNISDKEIEQALQLSCSEDFIEELPMGINEPVRERGSTFSAGQRQLLSFARAIAHNPSILVLDEATANIDTKTELLIQQSIENASNDRTTLIIAHRLSTIRNADKIIMLSKGKILEIGNHDELMKRGRYYKELYEAQYA
ncbi:ABC transporter ATP-binding protein [Proteiniborus sp. MB09-C3]|uniref:ABC transporter ATP-binding protein n=1 Tax=Proteiniborus sp. MB09-C3 TaxID=3050072 RepID=UPI002555E008|nr:ABC transporter ATP-binding protein [Proteiniborus sp. MB09-C3]WIV12419.1 ABC transporter ATP-binding protein [Proteiniborus sp. MB09-C3]